MPRGTRRILCARCDLQVSKLRNPDSCVHRRNEMSAYGHQRTYAAETTDRWRTPSKKQFRLRGALGCPTLLAFCVFSLMTSFTHCLGTSFTLSRERSERESVTFDAMEDDGCQAGGPQLAVFQLWGMLCVLFLLIHILGFWIGLIRNRPFHKSVMVSGVAHRATQSNPPCVSPLAGRWPTVGGFPTVGNALRSIPPDPYPRFLDRVDSKSSIPQIRHGERSRASRDAVESTLCFASRRCG
jgi:hypothetical protein